MVWSFRTSEGNSARLLRFIRIPKDPCWLSRLLGVVYRIMWRSLVVLPWGGYMMKDGNHGVRFGMKRWWIYCGWQDGWGCYIGFVSTDPAICVKDWHPPTVQVLSVLACCAIVLGRRESKRPVKFSGGYTPLGERYRTIAIVMMALSTLTLMITTVSLLLYRLRFGGSYWRSVHWIAVEYETLRDVTGIDRIPKFQHQVNNSK